MGQTHLSPLLSLHASPCWQLGDMSVQLCVMLSHAWSSSSCSHSALHTTDGNMSWVCVACRLLLMARHVHKPRRPSSDRRLLLALRLLHQSWSAYSNSCRSLRCGSPPETGSSTAGRVVHSPAQVPLCVCVSVPCAPHLSPWPPGAWRCQSRPYIGTLRTCKTVIPGVSLIC